MSEYMKSWANDYYCQAQGELLLLLGAGICEEKDKRQRCELGGNESSAK